MANKPNDYPQSMRLLALKIKGYRELYQHHKSLAESALCKIRELELYKEELQEKKGLIKLNNNKGDK
jgi:hypothetical protein